MITLWTSIRNFQEKTRKAAMSPPSFYFCRGRKVSASFLDRLRALVLSVFLIAAFAVPALAGPFEDAVAKFANDEFSDTDEAVGLIASSGNALAFPIILVVVGLHEGVPLQHTLSDYYFAFPEDLDVRAFPTRTWEATSSFRT